MSSRASSIAHMCGIAGYSFHPASRIDRTLAAQSLLAGIAERGADAAGYAYRGEPGSVSVHKQRSGASKLLERIAIPSEANQALIHVRDYTKGHPRIEANNHPVRHGVVKGVHNGIIVNDEEIFARHGFQRHEPEMTVDTEAIFALVDELGPCAEALEDLCGSMATAWFDEREPDTVYIARGVGRPLWLGEGGSEAFFASTKHALEVVERYLGVKLRKRELPEGILVPIVEGRRQKATRFKPDRAFEETPLPAVRAPHEGVTCLRRLAAIAAAL
jgi:glucosamine 6-phosphate synthetase-like amidotransferase/phosphosugar isomerase protein